MHRSIRQQLLLPFAVGLALLAVAVGVASVVAARAQAREELRSRADRALQVVRQTISQARAELGGDAAVLSQLQASEPLTGAALENRIVRLSVQQDLSHVSVTDARGRLVGADGQTAWTRSALARRLRAEAAGAPGPASLVGVSPAGEPLILAAARADGAGAQTVLVGRAIDRALLAPAEESTGVLVQLQTPRGTTRGSLQDAGTRTFRRSLRLGDTSATLFISTSDLRVEAATWSILMITGGGGILVLLLLMVFLQLLVGRSVVSPLRRLTGGVRRVQGGDHDARVALDGAEELRTLAQGFNAMSATVGEQHRRLERLATTDALTGVCNHRAFHEALGGALVQAEREARPVAIVALDLDHFKQLNDAHGHGFGDRMLQQVGAALRSVVREDDLVARIGGEEFALLLPAADAGTAMDVAHRSRTAIAAIDLEGVGITCSAGVAVFPDDTLDGLELLALADLALYAAKAGGRSRTRRYRHGNSAQLTPAQQRDEVRALIDDPSLASTLMQPVVSLTERRVVGFEALTRFDHPSERSPHEWFGMARRCGLGPELQALALRRAFAIGGRPEGTFLAVNVEPSALHHPEVVAAFGADLHDVVVEVTEQELITDHARLEIDLSALRARGARIALDDTGAGYAGLSHIVALRPEVIKVDKALVAGISGDTGKLALLDSFATFARRTGATLCAEGIETLPDLEVLVELGIEHGQGYLFARPGAGWPEVAAEPMDHLHRTAERRAALATELPEAHR